MSCSSFEFIPAMHEGFDFPFFIIYFKLKIAVLVPHNAETFQKITAICSNKNNLKTAIWITIDDVNKIKVK